MQKSDETKVMNYRLFKTLIKSTVGLFSVLLLILSISAYAKNLGRIGQVYPIKEMDIVEFIKSRLLQMEKSGELGKIRKKMVDTTKARAQRPKPVVGISPAKKYRKWFIDPSVRMGHDIKDNEGRIIVKAGTVVNPLKQIPFKRALLFFDGDRKNQVEWAQKQTKKWKGKEKLILVNGSVADQAKDFKKRIYFDQHGKLVSKFKIEYTPATVTQDNSPHASLQFKVEEVKL